MHMLIISCSRRCCWHQHSAASAPTFLAFMASSHAAAQYQAQTTQLSGFHTWKRSLQAYGMYTWTTSAVLSPCRLVKVWLVRFADASRPDLVSTCTRTASVHKCAWVCASTLDGVCVETKTRHLDRLGQLSEFEQDDNTNSEQESNTDSKECDKASRPAWPAR